MRALIAEDDPFTRKAIAEILSREGWETCVAENGKRAWELFSGAAFDLACLDVMMPGLSGYDLCRKIRESGSMVPVIFISAKSEEIDRVLGLELGADDFISKPFGSRELSARVRALMRRSAGGGSDGAGSGALSAPGASFDFCPWEVEPGSLRARSGGRTVDLTKLEACLLTLLREKRGKAVSRENFFKICWGWDAIPESRSLDQHIVALRKKLEPDPKNPILIETVQGVGYRHPDRESGQ
jgi:two-component system, OmpR family, alkaline phosphatase synthesis response regulator PhoP